MDRGLSMFESWEEGMGRCVDPSLVTSERILWSGRHRPGEEAAVSPGSFS